MPRLDLPYSCLQWGLDGQPSPARRSPAAFYVIALSQRASDVRVWTLTPHSLNKPASTGNLADSSLFVKFAKPLSSTLSVGFMGAFEQSDALLLPDNGATPIRFATSYLPSGGLGVHWHPDKYWQAGFARSSIEIDPQFMPETRKADGHTG